MKSLCSRFSTANNEQNFRKCWQCDHTLSNHCRSERKGKAKSAGNETDLPPHPTDTHVLALCGPQHPPLYCCLRLRRALDPAEKQGTQTLMTRPSVTSVTIVQDITRASISVEALKWRPTRTRNKTNVTPVPSISSVIDSPLRHHSLGTRKSWSCAELFRLVSATEHEHNKCNHF